MKYHLHIDYHLTEKPQTSTEAERQLEEASARLHHITALWQILKRADLRSPWPAPETGQELDEFSDNLRDFADLGAQLTDGLYSNIDTLKELHDTEANRAKGLFETLDAMTAGTSQTN